MSAPRKAGRVTGVAAAAALATVVSASWAAGAANAGFLERQIGEPLSCTYSAAEATMSLRVRDTRTRVVIPREFIRGLGVRVVRQFEKVVVEPTAVTIERRRDAIVAFASDEGLFSSGQDSRGPVPCRGGAPTVTNTDAIEVTNGRHTDYSDLSLDLTYGVLEPGLTPEADGSSEIEIDASVGGTVGVRMSRDADAVAGSLAGARTALNLNAAESNPDVDLLVGRRSEVAVNSAGAGDVLSSSKPEPDPDENLFFMIGGQGRDTMTGGPGADALMSGSGADTVDAGAGLDVVITSGKAKDQIDCGAGRDFVWVFGRGEPITRACETVRVRNFGLPIGNDGFFKAPRPVARTIQSLRALRRG